MEETKEKVIKATKAAYDLPDDIKYHRTLSRSFGAGLDDSSQCILDLTNSLLDALKASQTKDKKQKKRKLRDEDDLVNTGEFQARVVDWVDLLLEDADKYLDEWNGLKTGSQLPEAGPSTLPRLPVSKALRLPAALLDAKHLPKPQLQFSFNLSRDRQAVFTPTLTSKPNAIVPLDLTPVPCSGIGGSQQVYPKVINPYHTEMRQVVDNLPADLGQPHPALEPFPSDSFEKTPFLLVDSNDTFTQLLSHLASATEIAVDLEHHDYRTYHGLVCLVQISVPGHDFVVDVLVPEVRDRMVELNETFTNPKIIKVFHGAERDIIWLQRDFGVYVVGLFDTFQASKLLEYGKHSLAALLHQFVGFEADKRYQLADWRIRPMPAEMLYYARSDTHFLLYVYHSLLHALETSPAKGSIKRVFELSSLTSGSAFAFPPYETLTGVGPIGWRGIVQKWGKSTEYAVPPLPIHFALSPRSKTSLEFHVFRALHDWRDRIARDEDESPRFILNHASLFKLAEKRPTTPAAVLTIVSPVSTAVATRREALANLIKSATETWEELPDANRQAFVAPQQQPAPSSGPLGNVSASLWSQAKSKLATTTERSSLLGSIGDALQAKTSAFLGQPGRASLDAKFVQVLEKVHSSLFLASSFVTTTKTEATTAEAREEPKVSFVPAAARNVVKDVMVFQSHPLEKDEAPPAATTDDKDDVIIASLLTGGTSKKKKRKKAPVDGDDDDDATPKELAKAKKGKTKVKSEVPAYDPDEVSILDMHTTSKAEPKTKSYKRPKKAIEPSGHRTARAPKPAKQGNMSVTFS